MDDQFFLKWYQSQLVYMINDEGDLDYLFSQLTDFRNYHKEWRQNCLDFAYRTIKCGLCDFYWEGRKNFNILIEIANSYPDIGAIWKTYLLELTQKGEGFLLSCGVDGNTKEFSPLLKEKLSALFDEHGVGFDKSCFIPVVD